MYFLSKKSSDDAKIIILHHLRIDKKCTNLSPQGDMRLESMVFRKCYRFSTITKLMLNPEVSL